MRPLNLIPPEDRRGDSAPLRAGAASYAIVGVLALALVAVVALVLTSNKINDNKSQLASLEVRKAAAEQAALGLAPYNDFATLATSRSQTVSQLAQSRFDWERVLRELALVIPEDVTLDSLTAAAAAAGDPAATGAETSGSAITGPSLQIGGCAEGQEGVARLLAALRDIDGVTRVGMQSSTLSETGEGGPDGATSDSATESSGSGCERSGAATFAITVAFDAVPAAPATTPDATATPAATTTPTPETTAAAPTDAAPTADAGASEGQGQSRNTAGEGSEAQ